MDKEQIMIDGVDVSGCLFYQSNFEEDFDVEIKHFCSNWHNSCESSNNFNCYFKQLARKTQECEIWKNQVLILDEEDVTVQVTQEQFEEYKQLKQKCKQLKEDYAELNKRHNEAFQDFERLKREYSVLKKRATIAEDNFACEVQARLYHQNEWLKFSKECEELKKQLKTSEKWRINAESLNEKLDIKNTCYRKALEEIEKYCNYKFCDKFGDFTELINKNAILDIINKVYSYRMSL